MTKDPVRLSGLLEDIGALQQVIDVQLDKVHALKLDLAIVVINAIEHGATQQALADVLGISRQAVAERFYGRD